MEQSRIIDTLETYQACIFYSNDIDDNFWNELKDMVLEKIIFRKTLRLHATEYML